MCPAAGRSGARRFEFPAGAFGVPAALSGRSDLGRRPGRRVAIGGAREPLKKPLEGLFRRATRAADHQRLKHDAPNSGRDPPISRRDRQLPCPADPRDVLGDPRHREGYFETGINHCGSLLLDASLCQQKRLEAPSGVRREVSTRVSSVRTSHPTPTSWLRFDFFPLDLIARHPKPERGLPIVCRCHNSVDIFGCLVRLFLSSERIGDFAIPMFAFKF